MNERRHPGKDSPVGAGFTPAQIKQITARRATARVAPTGDVVPDRHDLIEKEKQKIIFLLNAMVLCLYLTFHYYLYSANYRFPSRGLFYARHATLFFRK